MTNEIPESHFDKKPFNAWTTIGGGPLADGTLHRSFEIKTWWFMGLDEGIKGSFYTLEITFDVAKNISEG